MNLQQRIKTCSQLFHVLSDETRIKLLLVLKDSESHVTDLCKKLKLPQPTVSHHLALLRVHGLVVNRRSGKSVFYSIDTEAFEQAEKVISGVLFTK